jgi:small subunit ribosomal protein S20
LNRRLTRERSKRHGKFAPSKEARPPERGPLPVNKARRSRIRTFLRRVEEAIASGDQTAAATALRAAQPELMRGVTKGVLHQNTASRKMSRLSSRVKAMAT